MEWLWKLQRTVRAWRHAGRRLWAQRRRGEGGGRPRDVSDAGHVIYGGRRHLCGETSSMSPRRHSGARAKGLPRRARNAREQGSPESITTAVSMDSGPAASRRPGMTPCIWINRKKRHLWATTSSMEGHVIYGDDVIYGAANARGRADRRSRRGFPRTH